MVRVGSPVAGVQETTAFGSEGSITMFPVSG
jgi:hypothetical protein